MKKLFSFLAAMLLLSFCVFPAFAADTASDVTVISLTADKDSLSPGETVKVTCTVTNTIKIGGFQFDVAFDTTRLELESYDFKKYLISRKDPKVTRAVLDTKGNSTVASINSDGYFRILYLYEQEPIKVDVNVGEIYVLTFKAKADCYTGTVVPMIKNVTLGDINAKQIPYAKSSVAIDVKGKEPSASSETSSETSSVPSSSQPSSSASTSGNDTQGSPLTGIVIGGTSNTIQIEDGKTEYTVHVDSKTNKIDIGGITNDENATVVTKGGDNLKEGENTVKVTVTDKDGSVKEYTVKVIKDKTGGNTYTIYIGAALLVAAAVALVLMIIKNNRETKA